MFTRLLTAVATCLLLASAAQAHFPWLSSDNEGRALLYFAESPQQTDYHLPEVVEKAVVTLHGAKDESKQLELESVDTDDFVGRKSDPDTVNTGVLTTACDYGNYHGMLLKYYVKHYAGELNAALKCEPKEAVAGFAIDVRPQFSGKTLELRVTREGKPVENASVTLSAPEGEPAEKKTDAEGVARFKDIAEGKLAAIVGVTVDAEGEVDGEKYTSEAHYATLTFDTSGDSTTTPKSTQQSALPPLPEPVASFGAVVAGDMVYVYSGHTGTAHAHSKENLSSHFVRAPLAGGEWESLPMETAIQGFPLIAHDGLVYRVGGMQAVNGPDEDDNLRSVDEFAVFDPGAKTWTSLAPLPEPRSSHDAVVVGDWLYVVGGWQLSGSDEGEWHDTTWKIDLTHPEEGWQPAAETPFRRRALAVSHDGNTLVAIGGIDEAGDISKRVDALDLTTGTWKELTDLPGEGMQGFGVSAWNLDGDVYVSGANGIVYRLTGSGDQWQEVAKHNDRRFFHRLLPAGKNRLLMIGGASMERESHVADSEWVELDGE